MSLDLHRRGVLSAFAAAAGGSAAGGFMASAAIAAPAAGPILDMSGTYPHYAAPVGFGRPPATSEVAEPLDLVFG